MSRSRLANGPAARRAPRAAAPTRVCRWARRRRRRRAQAVRRLGEHLEGDGPELAPEEYGSLVGQLDAALAGAAAYIRRACPAALRAPPGRPSPPARAGLSGEAGRARPRPLPTPPHPHAPMCARGRREMEQVLGPGGAPLTHAAFQALLHGPGASPAPAGPGQGGTRST